MARFDASQKITHDLLVQGGTEVPVFYARVNVQIVIDLNDHDILGTLLQIDTVESLSNQASCLDGGAQHRRRCVFDGQGGKTAGGHLSVAAVFLVFDDLLVSMKHEGYLSMVLMDWFAPPSKPVTLIFRYRSRHCSAACSSRRQPAGRTVWQSAGPAGADRWRPALYDGLPRAV